MIKLRATFICICLLSLVGCHARSGIVGEWTGTVSSAMGGAPIAVTARFSADGSYSTVTGSGEMSGETSGTYTYDDSTKQLTLNQLKFAIGGQELKMPGGNLAQAQTTSVTWTGDDEISIKIALGETSLKRK